MKFGQEYQRYFANESFPDAWRESAIEYKHLKKCIKKVRGELQSIGLDAETIGQLNEWVDIPVTADGQHESKGYYSAAEPSLDTVLEEFVPQLRVLVDGKTGRPIDAALAPETRASLQRLAKHEMILSGRKSHIGGAVQPPALKRTDSDSGDADTPDRSSSPTRDARWVQLPLASARDFFDLLEPKLEELDALRTAETQNLEQDILDLGDAVENVIEPVREGFEARRAISYRDLYFWREMFRLYLEKPIFYSSTESRRGALTFTEAKSRLEDYDKQLRTSGLMDKMKTPQAKRAAEQFLNVNVDILKCMQFQEMNARAMAKILKKFDKRTHIEGQVFLQTLASRYPALLTNTASLSQQPGRNAAGGFANSIARDLSAEISSKVLAIIPQLDDWSCPVCYAMAWKPVSLRCCKSVFCIRCVIHLQDEGMKRCPVCNRETVMAADGRNLDVEAMGFLEKYFPMETKVGLALCFKESCWIWAMHADFGATETTEGERKGDYGAQLWRGVRAAAGVRADVMFLSLFFPRQATRKIPIWLFRFCGAEMARGTGGQCSPRCSFVENTVLSDQSSILTSSRDSCTRAACAGHRTPRYRTKNPSSATDSPHPSPRPPSTPPSPPTPASPH